MTTLELPFPDKLLSPNARTHWGPRSRAVKRARINAAWEARIAGLAQIKAERLRISLTFHEPDNRRRDADGLISRMKSALDGIADVIGIDDQHFEIGDIIRAEPRPPHGAVIVHVEAVG